MTQTLRINGEEKEFGKGQLPQTLSELLDRLGINQATVVAEIDGRIIERVRFGETKLADGASIELVRFVGGG
jgi:thiamine biosynthesis protein ThiS